MRGSTSPAKEGEPPRQRVPKSEAAARTRSKLALRLKAEHEERATRQRNDSAG